MLVPEITKKINSDKVVVKYGNDYVLVSHSDYYQHPETLAFICDEEGNVSNWLEVAGGSGMTIADVITEISQYGINKNGAF
jgi:hypothetical protein